MQPTNKGRHVQIPNFLAAKPAQECDSSGTILAEAWDFIVNPLAVEHASSIPGMQPLLAEVVSSNACPARSEKAALVSCCKPCHMLQAKEAVAKARGSDLSTQHKIIKRKYKGLDGITG